MKEILMDTYKIIGEKAEEAADYINKQESRMIQVGEANRNFEEDYHENMKRFKENAVQKYKVKIEKLF